MTMMESTPVYKCNQSASFWSKDGISLTAMKKTQKNLLEVSEARSNIFKDILVTMGSK